MTARLRHAQTATAGRFPLRPGKPLVHRRSNGNWGFTCICHGHNRPDRISKASSYESHNCPSWRQALWEARDHVAYYHKTPAQYEIEALEASLALPAAERTHP